jgi:hypothetical protein
MFNHPLFTICILKLLSGVPACTDTVSQSEWLLPATMGQNWQSFVFYYFAFSLLHFLVSQVTDPYSINIGSNSKKLKEIQRRLSVIMSETPVLGALLYLLRSRHTYCRYHIMLKLSIISYNVKVLYEGKYKLHRWV